MKARRIAGFIRGTNSRLSRARTLLSAWIVSSIAKQHNLLRARRVEARERNQPLDTRRIYGSQKVPCGKVICENKFRQGGERPGAGGGGV